RISNAIVSFLIRLGINLGGTNTGMMALLTVRGRKSGKSITNAIVIIVQEGQRYLISPFGLVNWVRNRRAAGGEAIITRSRRSEKIRAIELPPQTAAPIFREMVRAAGGGNFVQSHLSVTIDSPIEDFEREIL